MNKSTDECMVDAAIYFCATELADHIAKQEGKDKGDVLDELLERAGWLQDD